ncbi:hypothetical protein Glove_180g67 [Diversispora epigaea]|uniref:Resolvase/invertase-type recombinase catalytic domain-containing protein n=1 Tax=Diversispora epigaea TaxID=1348612 RepID=A0A397IMV5_9GLOM|nr:hypothetical protein Glove_180g67 [Diversispora epigaea]
MDGILLFLHGNFLKFILVFTLIQPSEDGAIAEGSRTLPYLVEKDSTQQKTSITSSTTKICYAVIRSGFNWKRREFTSILEHVYQGNIKEVVVTRKDRLCRFAYELIEWIFNKHDVRIVVLGTNIESDTEGSLRITCLGVISNKKKRAQEGSKWKLWKMALKLIKQEMQRNGKTLKELVIYKNNFETQSQ